MSLGMDILEMFPAIVFRLLNDAVIIHLFSQDVTFTCREVRETRL